MAKKSGSSAADTIVKMVLMVFIALLSFSVGTYVGKQVSDSEHQKMALLEDYSMPRSVASQGQTHQGLTEEELAQLTAEFVEAERKDRGIASAPSQATPSAEGDAPEAEGYRRVVEPRAPASAPPQAAERVAQGQPPAPEKATAPAERKPDTVLPAVASSAVGKFTVQVASYANEEEAKNHAAQLQSAGWSSFYVPAEVNGKTWYRVSVGLFNNHRSANNFRVELMKEANISAAIVQKITQ